MLGLLGDDKGESFEDGLVPVGFEVDNHVSNLGEVEFNSIVGGAGARELLFVQKKGNCQ